MTRKFTSRRYVAALATASCLVLGSACSKRTTPAQVQAHVLRKSELTTAELEYGRGVLSDPEVEYQRDVVIVDHGPDVIRSAGADGITWTIDARAGRDLSVGKIAFVTGRCVGRILSMEREGDNLRLLLGPVELTEIFKKLNVNVDQPIDLAQAIPLPALSIPNLKLPVEGEDAGPPDWALRSWKKTSTRLFPLSHAATLQRAAYWQAVAPGIPQRLDLSFKTTPLKIDDGFGMELAHDADGVRLIAQVQLRLKQPRLEFNIHIDDSKLLDARVILHNAASIHLAFDSAVSQAFSGNVKWYLPAGGFSIPFSSNLPLAINIRQDIWVETVFSAKQSVYNAAADYDVNADVGFIFQNGSFSLIGPKGLTVRKGIMTNMSGVSVGARGLLLSHALTVTGGLGVWEFSTGPSFSLGTSLGGAMGASEGIIQCRSASLSLNLRAGVGWTIPPVVAKFVNFFLRIIKGKEIPDHGGLYTPWKVLFVNYAQTNDPICGS